MIKFSGYLIVTCWSGLLLFATVSCADNRLKEALSYAKENSHEWEKVLKHYENEPLKKKAAQFLITNMIGYWGPDSTEVFACRKFTQEYDSLSRIYQYETSVEWGEKVDSIWEKFGEKVYYGINKKKIFDLQVLKADFIIHEIDLAFRAWNNNIYTRECSFDDFCEYILPYRRKNGALPDQKRAEFYQKYHEHFFSQSGKDFIDEADSLLYKYNFLTHSCFYGTRIPILAISQMEYMRHGLCEDRCWFNIMLFSSLGMAAAMDFVPGWANRNGSHSWNVLIVNGVSYPFEPFWDADRWKYKRIYNNKTFDEAWGRFRLSKVFRRTYGAHMDAILKDTQMDIEDIPEVFRDVRKKDVSHEYFDTVNVTLTLQNVPDDERYAYLCTFNTGKWNPVQWAKIEGKTVVFKGMGRDVVYLPAYYRKGSVIGAGTPFLLQQDGTQKSLNATWKNEKSSILLRHNVGATYHSGNVWNNRKVAGTVLLGDVTPYFTSADTLCVFPQNIGIYRHCLSVNNKRKLRYVRMTLPYYSIALNELAFIAESGKRISDVHFIQKTDSTENGEKPEYVLDNISGTGYLKLGIEAGYIDIDLGDFYVLSEIRYIPYRQILLDDGIAYELLYWKDGWKLLDSATFSGKPMAFDNIPQDALLLLRPKKQKGRISYRPFICRDEELRWY